MFITNYFIFFKSDCTTLCVFPDSLANHKYYIYLDSNPHIELCSAK